MSPRDPLLAQMRLALFAEFGALAMYGRLCRSRRDRELSELLSGFRAEEEAQIVQLRALMQRLGGRPPARRRRREIAPAILHLASFVVGSRLPLRLCLESEETVARWYAGFAAHLAREGAPDEARVCEALSVTKQRHALALRAWVAR
jgi:hypothetical protein